MNELITWYTELAVPLKTVFWVLVVFLGLAIVKRLVKIALLVTLLIIVIFVAALIL